MKKMGCYLVCHGHIGAVKKFLGQFFVEKTSKYTYEGWVTYVTDQGFLINLMPGKDQALTQNMTFEIYCGSRQELDMYAKKYDVKIESFLATSSGTPYYYNYIELFGPENICKVEINYSEDAV